MMRGLLVAIALLAGLDTASAGNPLGTAGPLRSVGWKDCAGDVLAPEPGPCDPPPVDPGLPPSAQAQAHVARAVELLAVVRMPQAKRALDAALAVDPDDVEARRLRGRIAIPTDMTAAEVDINAGLMQAPHDADLLATRAFILRGRRDLAGAMADATAAVDAEPYNADALWIRAQVRSDLGSLAAAESDLTVALAVDPDHKLARLFRAQLRLRLGHLQQAADDAGVILTQQPGDYSAIAVRSRAYFGLGRLDAAVADLTALLGEPGRPTTALPSMAIFADLYMQRAVALTRLGRERDAMADLDTLTTAGGPRAILQMQVYLRGHGFADVPIDGKRSDRFDEAVKACFIDAACGRGMAIGI